MKAPTSTYGCGADSCEACHGDMEWRILNLEGYRPMAYQHWKAKNDANGNPRRAFVLFANDFPHPDWDVDDGFERGDIIAVVDEEYHGYTVINHWMREHNVPQLPDMKISGREHTLLLREHLNIDMIHFRMEN
jgi:hypothetical protein